MNKEYNNIKVIGFDADDTLWVNETYYREAEDEFTKLLSAYETPNKTNQELFKKEMEDLHLYGYGVKSFVLSMIETAIEVSNNSISSKAIQDIINIGKKMINNPVELLEGAEEVLKSLFPKYRLIMATKGDLLDQERKLKKSGLAKYFHHIEVLSDKKEANYLQLLNHLDIDPSEFLMIGNSLKSDVLPLINIKARAIHVPYHTTWEHEQVNDEETNGKIYKTIANLTEVLNLLQ